MKTIFKPKFWGINGAPKLPVIILNFFSRLIFKTAILTLFLAPAFNKAYGQHGTNHKTTDSMLYFFAGISKMYVNRQAFDQWTLSNFNLIESYRPSVYLDLGLLYKRVDFGFSGNIGSSFQNGGVYFGTRLTGPRSFVGSWLNIEMGDFFAHFYNISPPTYNPVPTGQQLQLDYHVLYISLTSKNYLNFLSYTAKLGHARIPVNAGFFVSAGWHPGGGKWDYGYYDQDSVFHYQKLKPIPKPGKVQGTVGLFMGF